MPPQSVRTGANVQGASPREQHIAAPVDLHQKKKRETLSYLGRKGKKKKERKKNTRFGLKARGNTRTGVEAAI